LEQLGTPRCEGVYTLHDLLDFHELLDEREENMRRCEAAHKEETK
jgi:hypothetical protein